MKQKLFWILLLCVSFPCFFQQAGSSQKESKCYSLFKESSSKPKPAQIEESSLKTKEIQTDKDVIESLIKKVINNQDTDIKLSECGAGCFKLDSSLSKAEHKILIDSKAVSPLQEGSILTVPSLKQLESSVIRRWLIGHELHPYTSQAVSFSSKTAVLRPSQQIAVSDFKEALSQGYSRFLHISPTSTGKSPVLAKNLIEKLKSKNSKKLSFISVDKIKLVDQLHKQIQAEAQAVDFDLKQVHWIAQQGKSFFEEILKALKTEKPVVISLTLKSFISQMEKLKERDSLMYSRVIENTDGIYIDEVHHLGAKQTSRFILDLVEKSQAFLYGATATPVHKDLEIQALFEKVHWSYLEETSFDSLPPSMVIDQLSLSIQKGDITPFNDIYVVLAEKLVSLAESPVFIQKPDQALFSVNPEHYARLRDLLGVIFESNRKGMIIVSTIREAEELSEFLNEEGMMGIEFEAYHSGMSVERREDVFRNSREKEFHYIVAVRALDEGINLPHLSAYIDLNPHISVKQIVHRIGRVLRPSLDKLKADIFILSSYKDSEKTRELMDSVEQIKQESGLRDNRRISVLNRARLKDLSRESYEFVLKQEEFWKAEKSFPSYEEAQRITQQAGITTQTEYRKRYKELGLPSNPNSSYKEQWQSWGHFLGTGRTWTRGTDFLSFEDLQEQVRKAGIKSKKEYIEYRKKNKELGLPSSPNEVYKDQWQSWREFLGTNFLSFEALQEQVRKAGILTQREYKKRYKEHEGWPSSPNGVYKDQWPGWRKFLGTNFLSFKEAQRIAQQAGIRSREEYLKRYKVLGLPSKPNSFYKEQWQGWGEFLGTGRTATKSFPSYEEAQRIAQKAGITTQKEYQKRYKELGLPFSPHRYYKEQWQGWREFLGTNFPSFEEAQRIAQKAGITTQKEYQKRYKELGLSSSPHRYYKEQWQAWAEFLGTERTRTKRTDFLSFEDLQEQVRKAGIPSSTEYFKIYKEHKSWPSRPNEFYKEQWQGWEHFLGTGKNFLSFEALQEQVRKAGITTQQEYRKRYKEHEGWPSSPNEFYKEQWQGWGEFLSLSFEDAKKRVREEEITNFPQYKENCKRLGLPTYPFTTYKGQWKGWLEFFGFPSFQEAKQIIQNEGITSFEQYQERHKALNLPPQPHITYRYEGWDDTIFFSYKDSEKTREFSKDLSETGRTATKSFPSYKKAQELVQNEKITTIPQYKENFKRLGLPGSPFITYKGEWKGWLEFFGFPSFQEAKQIIQNEGITSKQYQERHKALNLPPQPHITYRYEGWKGMADFFGINFN